MNNRIALGSSSAAGMIAFAAVLISTAVAIILVWQNFVLVDELRSTFLDMSVYASSSSDNEEDSEDISEEAAGNSTNATGWLTEEEKFGFIMRMVQNIPMLCEAQDENSEDAELWQEACRVYQKYYR